jgi:four helix bundle protein
VRFEEWVMTVPQCMRDDSLWNIEAYRLALFVSEIGWHDVTKLSKDRRTRSLSDQLNRALNGISATIAEGYSRGTGMERARFYEYALGSAREARDEYYKARHVLGEKVTEHRMDLLTQITKLALTMVTDQRRSNIRLNRSR